MHDYQYHWYRPWLRNNTQMYEFPCLENPSWRVIKSIRVLQEAEVMMEESDFFFFSFFKGWRNSWEIHWRVSTQRTLTRKEITRKNTDMWESHHITTTGWVRDRRSHTWVVPTGYHRNMIVLKSKGSLEAKTALCNFSLSVFLQTPYCIGIVHAMYFQFPVSRIRHISALLKSAVYSTVLFSLQH